MEIITKFNIGDTIYIIYSNNEDMWCIKEVIILGIKIFIEEREINIRYDTQAIQKEYEKENNIKHTKVWKDEDYYKHSHEYYNVEEFILNERK